MHGNQLTGSIPPELGGLSNLEGLSLEQNQLTGNIPVELGRLSNPRYLGLQDNQPTGCIPTELSNTPELKVSTDGLETCPQVEQH